MPGAPAFKILDKAPPGFQPGFPCPGGGVSLRVLAAAARNLVNTSHETEELGLGTQLAGGSTLWLTTVRACVPREGTGVQAEQQVSMSTVLVAELPSMQRRIYIPTQMFSCSSQTLCSLPHYPCVRCHGYLPTAAMPPPSQCPQERPQGPPPQVHPSLLPAGDPGVGVGPMRPGRAALQQGPPDMGASRREATPSQL